MESPRTPQVDSFLQPKFTQLIKQFNGSSTTTEAWTNALLKAYTEPQRHYHTTRHIHSMLQSLQTQLHPTTNPTAIQLAIFFHDWVYDPTAHDNELQSIEILKKFSDELKLPEELSDRVCHYIEATITHSLSPQDAEDADLRLFLDFDLEVLSRDAREYEEYSKQIREEYSNFSEVEYAKGRVAVLEKFLKRERLYFSDEFHREFEERARRNLKMEIGMLKERFGSSHET